MWRHFMEIDEGFISGAIVSIYVLPTHLCKYPRQNVVQVIKTP